MIGLEPIVTPLVAEDNPTLVTVPPVNWLVNARVPVALGKVYV